MDDYKNFAYSTLAAGISAGATSCSVASGTGPRFPSTAFDAVIWDSSYPSATAAVLAGAGEQVRVTARSTDALTITRAQGGTSAVALNTTGRTYAIAQVLTESAFEAMAPKDSPTFTGPITSSGAVVSAGTAMSGVEVNVALRDNLYSATADATWTHSATPAVGQEYGVVVTTDGTARTITYPITAFSQARGADITSSTFPANSTNKIIVRRTAIGYLILGDPLTLAQMRTALGLATVATSGSAADLSAGVLAPARIASGGSALQVVRLNAGNTALEYADPGVGSGDVTAASNFSTDNRIIRSDGTGKGVQSSGAAINDSGEIQMLGDSIPGSIKLSDGHATVPVSAIISAPVSYSSGYTLVLPTSPGTAGQAIRIASVSGSTLALEFYTP